MITFGLDPSLCSSGLVFLEDGKIIRQSVVKSKPIGKTPDDELERLLLIKNDIIGEMKGLDIDFIVMEGLAFNARNTTSLVQLAGLNYILREYFYEDFINGTYKNRLKPFVIVQPTSLKKFVTGKGNSKKDIMMLETYKSYNESFSDNNLCDAYNLSKIGEAILNDKIKLTKPQQEVIKLLK